MPEILSTDSWTGETVFEHEIRISAVIMVNAEIKRVFSHFIWIFSSESVYENYEFNLSRLEHELGSMT